MKEGKMSNEALNESILSRLSHQRQDILIGPGVGEDCAAIAFGDLACVLTTDPITGATKDVGKIAVHISCNDIASSGVEPIALLMTLLLPLEASEEDANAIMVQAHQTASEMNVAIVGGHTEFTSAVTRPVVSVTAIGKGPINKLRATASAEPGDLLVISKYGALEGTAIIANEKTEELKVLGLTEALLDEAKALLDQLSVVPEGRLGAQCGVHAMHDVTEGGVYGAVWELCEASKVGAVIQESAIPLCPSTQAICKAFDLDPYRLISSGVMLMAVPKAGYEQLKSAGDAQGIKFTVIGQVTSDKALWIEGENGKVPLMPPDTDELYKVFQ